MARDDDLDGLRPYLELAREIRAEVERVASGDPGSLDLGAALDRIPRREREQVTRAVFARLAPDEQWAVLERVFGDDEVRGYLTELRRTRLDEIARRRAELAIARDARAAGRIDVDDLPGDVALSLGLFRPEDVHAAIPRGRSSSVCARLLVVRTTGDDGVVHVLEDVFNPERGLFVTPDYDEAVWAGERLASHARARIGSLAPVGRPELEPILYPGGRVDVEVEGAVVRGRLHLGFATVGDEDVFAATS